jgi:multiple antibiotic resistance protein
VKRLKNHYIPAMDASFFSLCLTAFIPIFVAMDAFGLAPVYLGLVEPFTPEKRRTILLQSVLTAGLIGVAFVFLGKSVFHFMGITISDFKVAGGLILLILSIHDLVFKSVDYRKTDSADTVGVVPLGMPLIMGPGTLTAIIVLIDTTGVWPTFFSLIVNLIIILVVCTMANKIVRLIGKGGSEGLSKIANLMLAAIAVMIIRSGVIEIIRNEISK